MTQAPPSSCMSDRLCDVEPDDKREKQKAPPIEGVQPCQFGRPINRQALRLRIQAESPPAAIATKMRTAASLTPLSLETEDPPCGMSRRC